MWPSSIYDGYNQFVYFYLYTLFIYLHIYLSTGWDMKDN
jgi:hypothetical protein